MRLLSFILMILAFVVVVLGATTRLKNAGLGCPDWPGCYGHLTVPSSSAVIGNGPLPYEYSPDHKELEPQKAWAEMIHRYVAGTLGLLIVANLVLSIIKRKNRRLSLILFLITLFQAALGMWTVTLKLHPVVVMLHLTGGLSLFTLSALLWIKRLDTLPQEASSSLVLFSRLGFLFLVVQILLGGWTSANYASLACPDFPTCQGSFWPAMNFKAAFLSAFHFGQNYEFGILDIPARTAIHMLHRINAVFVFILLAGASGYGIKAGGRLRLLGFLVLCLLCLQVILGISNVVLSLPLHVAVAHTANAALLLASVTAFVYGSKSSPNFR